MTAGSGVNTSAQWSPDDQRLLYQQKVVDLAVKVLKDLGDLPLNATDDQARQTFKNLVDPLLELSKCPDLIVNRGHLFGTMLPDAEKRALIEFLKTF